MERRAQRRASLVCHTGSTTRPPLKPGVGGAALPLAMRGCRGTAPPELMWSLRQRE